MLLVYALSRTTETGWGSPSTLGLFAAAGSLLLVFLGIEAKSRSPLVPASAVRNRTLVAANLSAFLLFGAFFSFIFLGSLLMQQMLGYSPTTTGVAWLGTTVISFFAAAFTGAKVVGVLGVRRVLVVGLTILAVAGFLLTRIEPGAEYATDLLPALLLAGIAGGMCAPAVQLGALSGVAPSMRASHRASSKRSARSAGPSRWRSSRRSSSQQSARSDLPPKQPASPCRQAPSKTRSG